MNTIISSHFLQGRHSIESLNKLLNVSWPKSYWSIISGIFSIKGSLLISYCLWWQRVSYFQEATTSGRLWGEQTLRPTQIHWNTKRHFNESLTWLLHIFKFDKNYSRTQNHSSQPHIQLGRPKAVTGVCGTSMHIRIMYPPLHFLCIQSGKKRVLSREKGTPSSGPPFSSMAGKKLHNTDAGHPQSIWYWLFYAKDQGQLKDKWIWKYFNPQL